MLFNLPQSREREGPAEERAGWLYYDRSELCSSGAQETAIRFKAIRNASFLLMPAATQSCRLKTTKKSTYSTASQHDQSSARSAVPLARAAAVAHRVHTRRSVLRLRLHAASLASASPDRVFSVIDVLDSRFVFIFFFSNRRSSVSDHVAHQAKKAQYVLFFL